MDKKLSISDKLVISAYSIEEEGQSPFSAEDLVVRAWQKFPDAFGLAGCKNDVGKSLYPDSNRVFAEIMGSKPIRQRGYLIKVGKKIYELTTAGREYAKNLLGSANDSKIKKSGLPREIIKELKRLLFSKAVEKFKNNRNQEITFHDACVFWGISPRSSAIEFNGRIANLEKIIEAVIISIKERIVTFEHGAQTYSEKDISLLRMLHEHMLAKFESEIAVIKKRTDER